MRYRHIWKRGQRAYDWRINRRARRYMADTGGASQTGLVVIILFVAIAALVIGLVG